MAPTWRGPALLLAASLLFAQLRSCHGLGEAAEPPRRGAAAEVAAEEAEEEFNEVQAVQGEVLVGLVICFMCTLYFLHYPDKDIRKYANSAMSDTISIFSAVMTFSSLNCVLENITAGWTMPVVMALRASSYFFCYASMLIILSVFTGVIGMTGEERAEIMHDPVRMQNRRNGIKLAGVFGHITGFAGIAFWSHLQGLLFAGSPAESLLILPLSMVVSLLFLHYTMHLYRGWVMQDKHVDRLERLWEETIWEVENDFVALIESFLVVQSVRFAILGRLPSPEGSDNLATPRTGFQIFELYLFSVLVFMSCCGIILWKTKFARFFATGLKQARERIGSWLPRVAFQSDLRRPLNPQEAEEDLEEAGEARHTFVANVWRAVTQQLGRQLSRGVSKMSSMTSDIELSFYMRVLDIFQNMFIMTYAWSFFYASRWLLDGWHLYGLRSLTDDAAVSGVGLNVAAFVTLSSALLIIMLDWVHDKAGTSKDVRRVLRRICEGVGILIGFAWEQCFDVAVGAVGARMHYSSSMRVGLGLLCVGVVVPAWLWHIIPVHEEKGYLFGVVPTKTAAKLKDALRGAANDPEKTKKVTDKWKALLKELHSLHEFCGSRMGTTPMGRQSTLMSGRASTPRPEALDDDATSGTPIKLRLTPGLGPLTPPFLLQMERNLSAPSTARSNGSPPPPEPMERHRSTPATARSRGKNVSFRESEPSELDAEVDLRNQATKAQLLLLVERWEQTSQQVLQLLEHLEGGSTSDLPSAFLQDKSPSVGGACLTVSTCVPPTVSSCCTESSTNVGKAAISTDAGFHVGSLSYSFPGDVEG